MRALQGILGFIVMTGLLFAIGYGCWLAESEGVLDRDSEGAPEVAAPPPPSTWDAAEESSEDQIWGDRWVSFSEKPEVCAGVLRFEGRARNGAGVDKDASDSTPFVLYRTSELAPSYRAYIDDGVDPVAGFLEPAGAGYFYSDLDRSDIVATTFRTGPAGFAVESEWPAWLPEPGKMTLGIWGYQPDYGGEDNIRLIRISEC